MRLFTVPAIIATLGGCAASPTVGEAVQAPNARLFDHQIEEKGTDAAVIVIREGAFQASNCYFALYVDGKLAARLDSNEKAKFYLTPGRRLIGVGSDPEGAGNCSGNSSYKREVATWVQAGEQQIFRISFQPMLDIRPSSY